MSRRLHVLVACEFSGRVRDAVAARGHRAVSCDLVDSDTAGTHLRCDAREAITSRRWDVLIAFPPCTHLSASGSRWWPGKQADGRQQAAIDFFLTLWHADIDRVAIENPAGIMTRTLRAPDQYVHPWWFGDPWRKLTGLWLRGLPLLVADRPVTPTGYWTQYSGDATHVRGGVRNPRARSVTHAGLARAMAEQWTP